MAIPKTNAKYAAPNKSSAAKARKNSARHPWPLRYQKMKEAGNAMKTASGTNGSIPA